MEFFKAFLESLIAIHINGAITVWAFIVHNFLIFLVMFVVLYLFVEEVKEQERELIQDNRRLM